MTTTAAQALEALRQIDVALSATPVLTVEQMGKVIAEVESRTSTLRQHIESTAAELEAMRKDAERWTSVDDEFPPDGFCLVTATNPAYCFGFPHVMSASFRRWIYDNEVKAFNVIDARGQWTVTHWMKAPRPAALTQGGK